MSISSRTRGSLATEGVEEPSGSGAGSYAAPAGDPTEDPNPTEEDPVSEDPYVDPYPRQPARPGVRMRGGSRRPLMRCTCSETLVRLQRVKLVVLQGIEGQLERQTALQEEMVRLKRDKLQLQQRQLALAEAQYNRPSISVPILLPQDRGEAHFKCFPALCHVFRSMSLIYLLHCR